MTNRDLLKEAIADAKAVKEVAITNAKAALEEAFTPHLKSMLEQKLASMEEENDYVAEESMHNTKRHGRKEVAEVAHDEEDIDLEELLRELEGEDAEESEEDLEDAADDLEDAEEDEEEDEELDFDNMTAEDLESFIGKVVDEMIAAGELEGGHEGMEDEAGAEDEMMMESQTVTDLITMLSDAGIVDNANAAKAIIVGLGAAGVGAGAALATAVQAMVKKMKGKTSENLRESQMMTDLITMLSDSGIVDNANAAKAIIVGLGAAGVGAGAALTTAVQAMVAKMKGKTEEQSMMENKKPVNEIVMTTAILATLGLIGSIMGGAWAKASADEKAEIAKKAEEFTKSGKSPEEAAKMAVAAVKGEGGKAYGGQYGDKGKAVGSAGSAMTEETELEEALNVINTLRSELHEINLLNSKLLYTNKIFKAKNLSEAQKVQILTAFDNAETVKETKLVYETLSSNLNKSSKKELVKENRSFASKTISGTSNKQPVMETSAMVERFQKLAGLK